MHTYSVTDIVVYIVTGLTRAALRAVQHSWSRVDDSLSVVLC
jgi:hypothetical protein